MTEEKKDVSLSKGNFLVEEGEIVVEDDQEYHLKRTLRSRHIFMIAIGSSIGMGLWLGSGSSLASGGPAAIFIGYLLAASIAWALNQSIGELAVLYPVPSAFPQWTRRLADPSLGFTLGWTYWFNYMITIPNELSGLCTVLAFWDSSINPAVWITVFLIVLIIINVFVVNVFAETEFVMSTIKFTWIFIVIVTCIVISAGGGPQGSAIGFKYWKEEPFTHGFKGFLSVLPTTIFAMSGMELSGVTAAEAINPKQSIPKAVQSIWIRLGLFYILGCLMVTITVSPNDPNLFGGSGVNASPFVIAFRNAGLPILGDLHNVVILISVLSSGNAAMYCGPRMLMGMAQIGSAPKIFGKTDKSGRPWYGFILTTAFGGGLAYLNVNNTGAEVFSWFSSLISLCTLYVWGCVFLCNIRQRKAWNAQGRSLSDMPWKSRVVPWTAWYGLILCIILVIVEFYLAVWPLGKAPTARTFFADYISIILTILIYLAAKVYYKGKFLIPPTQIDLDKGRRFYGPEDDEPEDDFFVWIWKSLKGMTSKGM